MDLGRGIIGMVRLTMLGKSEVWEVKLDSSIAVKGESGDVVPCSISFPPPKIQT